MKPQTCQNKVYTPGIRSIQVYRNKNQINKIVGIKLLLKGIKYTTIIKNYYYYYLLNYAN